jgi:hypothetical protein
VVQWQVTVDYAGLLAGLAEDVFVRVHGDRNRVTVSFGVEAPTLREATETAMRRAEALGAATVDGPPVTVAVVLADERSLPFRRVTPDLVDAAGARAILGGISQQAFVRLQRQDPHFPAPVERFGAGRGVWTKADVEAFARRVRQPAG